MSLATPESVQKLQTALHDKAKKSPDFRFYALYDKLYRKDVLTFAYACSKANGRPAGRSWRVDEAVYQGAWPLDLPLSSGRQVRKTIDFRLSRTRDVFAAKAFRHEGQSPHTVTLDGHAASHRAVREMRADGLLPKQNEATLF